MVTMACVISRYRLKVPPGISSSCISPLTSSGQRSRASWASQPQKSATLSPQPGGLIGCPECTCKHGTQTVDHLIFECERLVNERAKLKSSVLKVGKWPVNKSELTNRHLKQLLTYIILYYIILYYIILYYIIYILYILTQ